jgi:hypothetical protein
MYNCDKFERNCNEVIVTHLKILTQNLREVNGSTKRVKYSGVKPGGGETDEKKTETVTTK